MNGSQKLENLLHLSLEATPEERGKSSLLNVGVDQETERWELIIRYHGDVEVIRALPNTTVDPLLGGYAIVWTTKEQIPQAVDRTKGFVAMVDYMNVKNEYTFFGYGSCRLEPSRR